MNRGKSQNLEHRETRQKSITTSEEIWQDIFDRSVWVRSSKKQDE